MYSPGDKVGIVVPHAGIKGSTLILKFKNSVAWNTILFIVTLFGQLQMTWLVNAHANLCGQYTPSSAIGLVSVSRETAWGIAESKKVAGHTVSD